MAAMKFIQEAGFALEDSVCELVTLLKAFHQLAEEVGGPLSSAEWPSWLFTMEARARVIDERTQAYIGLVHQHARPVLEAIECTSLKEGLRNRLVW
jgi:hypothetical protein